MEALVKVEQAGFYYLHLSVQCSTHFHDTEVLLSFSRGNIFPPRSRLVPDLFVRFIFELGEENQYTKNLQDKKVPISFVDLQTVAVRQVRQ